MSTKTSIKRIALVAVSALGFGLLSVVPAKAAAISAVTEVSGVSISQTTGNTGALNQVQSMDLFIDPHTSFTDGATATLKARVSSFPAGINSVTLDATDVDVANEMASVVTTDLAATVVLTVTEDAGTDTFDDNGNTKFATVKFTPTVAGSYTILVWHDFDGDGSVNGSEQSASSVVLITEGGSATETTIKGTAAADGVMNTSAVSLTTVEPSNRVGVPVIVTPGATFENPDDAGNNASAVDGRKATIKYLLTKPAGSAAALNIASEAILSGAAIADNASATRSGTNLTFTPDVAGTYTVTAFHDVVADGAVSTGEASTSKSYVIGADELKMTVTTYGSLLAGADDAGSLLVKIALTGADGKAASLAANETITVTRTAGTAAIDFVTNDGTFAAGFGDGSAADTAATTYTFNAAQFSSAGVAAFLVNDATAEGLSTWTITGSGGKAASLSYSMTTTASKTTTTATDAATVTVANTGAVGVYESGADYEAAGTTTEDVEIAYGKATGVKLTASATTAATAGSPVAYEVTDTSGNLTGIAGAKYRAGVATATSGGAVSITPSLTLTLDAAGNMASAKVEFISATGKTGWQIAAAYPKVNTVTNPDLQIRSVTADTNTIRVLVKDQFGVAFPTASVTPTVTGRNATVGAQPTLWTNANGYAYYTLKDVSTSTTSLTDTVKFTSSGVQSLGGVGIDSTAATVITYVSSLNVGTVTLTSPNSAEETAGTALTPNDINAGSGGAEDGAIAVTALVKDTNGSILTGVKVTWTIAGDGSAVTSTTVTGYTNASGVATASAYAWLAGTKTITATVGGVAKAGKLAFAQNTPEEVRTATATADGRAITVVAKDRFGNVVKNVPFTATIQGNGFFGTGTNVVSNALTDVDGTVKFLVLQGSEDFTVKVNFGASPGPAAPFGQSATKIGSFDSIGTSAFAASQGTTERDETFVGNNAGFLPAGGFETVMPVTIKADIAIEDTLSEATSGGLLAVNSAQAAIASALLAREAALAAKSANIEAQTASSLAETAVKALSRDIFSSLTGIRTNLDGLSLIVTKSAQKLGATGKKGRGGKG